MWTDECKTCSLCCSRCIQRSWLSRVLKRMTLSPTRGRTRWRHGGDCRNDMIRRQEEGNETFCERSFLLDGAPFWNFKRGSNALNPVSRYEKKLKDKLDDEIKLAGLEALVPEELEKHLILNEVKILTQRPDEKQGPPCPVCCPLRACVIHASHVTLHAHCTSPIVQKKAFDTQTGIACELSRMRDWRL